MQLDGDQLIEQLLAGGDGVAAQGLVDAFYSGYPIERLRLLLNSDDERVLKHAAWISSELGGGSRPLVGEIAPLLEHPARYVRFFALDAILVGATSRDGDAIARAVLLIEDSDAAVRRKAMYFLGRATTEQLAAAVPYIGDTHLKELLTWLLHLGNTSEDTQDVVRRLSDDDPVTQRCAAAAALRLSKNDRGPLEHAVASPDREIVEVAREEIEDLVRSDRLLAKRREQGGCR